MTDRKTFAPGVAALLAGIVLVFGTLVVLGAPAATAQPPEVGSLTVTPNEGSVLTAPGVTTSAPCPEAANGYHIRLTGPQDLDNFAAGLTTAGYSETDPFTGQFTNTFDDVAATDTPPKDIVAGTYTIDLNCVGGALGQTVVATFRTTVVFSQTQQGLRYVAADTPPTSTSSSSSSSSSGSSSSSSSSSTTTTTDPPTSTTDPSSTTDTTTEAPVVAASNQRGLPNTGAAPVPLLWIGFLLCAIGSLYLLAARRRRVG